VNVELARDPRASMILIDIPGYRTLSDLLGYDFGLHVMLQVASRIREAVSATNIRHLIGHEGRDSFALFVRLQRASDLERLIARLREAMQEPVTLDERSANVRITIGSARAPEDGTTGEALLANAGLALSADVARSDAQSIHRTYSPVLRERSESRHSLLAQIHSGAVEAGEFAVFLQPTFSLDQNIAVGAEALVRWDHPTRGLLMPAEFLGLEPDGSTIVEIGRFVIDYVCAFIADRHDWDLPISINLAPEQLLDPRFASLALESIRSAGIQPGLITFEVLEDTLLNNSSAIEHNVIRLRSAGVRIALDDFGTGYSGLSHLSRMPVDILKVDRQFVERAEHDRDAIILEAIRFMAENLGLLTIAEGVETVRQRDALLRLGYTRGQGYFFCRPIRATGMPSWLAENQPKRQRAANE
jgi:diguanylate cyclase (GGDEF)-like protein